MLSNWLRTFDAQHHPAGLFSPPYTCPSPATRSVASSSTSSHSITTCAHASGAPAASFPGSTVAEEEAISADRTSDGTSPADSVHLDHSDEQDGGVEDVLLFDAVVELLDDA